jgi:hypothetical protein
MTTWAKIASVLKEFFWDTTSNDPFFVPLGTQAVSGGSQASFKYQGTQSGPAFFQSVAGQASPTPHPAAPRRCNQ